MELTGRHVSGFSTPRTVTGRSSLVQPLPHYISVDALHVTFRCGEKNASNFLPPGLEPVDGGLGWVMIGELTKVSASDPDQIWRNPERCNYNECVLGFYARHGDKVGRYSALVWVDRDWSLVMGQIFGWAKRLATVSRTRIHDMNPVFRGKLPPKVGGTVERNGVRIIQAAVDLRTGVEELERLPDFGSTTYLYRYLASPGPGVPEVNLLMELKLGDVWMSKVQKGKGELSFQGAEDEELDLLKDAEVLDGYLYKRGWTTDAKATLVCDLSKDRGA